MSENTRRKLYPYVHTYKCDDMYVNQTWYHTVEHARLLLVLCIREIIIT